MRIINLVDNLERVNFGIWNAAVATAPALFKLYGIESHIWFPASNAPANLPVLEGVTPVSLVHTANAKAADIIEMYSLNPKHDIIVSHGAWQWPTRLAHKFEEMGFHWIYVPHGMLEPWSMKQKWLKKFIYYNLIERPKASDADYVRAVGGPEAFNLSKTFQGTVLIPNGTDNIEFDPAQRPEKPLTFLFMARLHHKKGVIPMAEAWLESGLKNNPDAKLLIAGPDDGELAALQAILQKNPGINIEYTGPVYGPEKEKLLKEAHFYLLPSLSEGFPTSVVEAMLYGQVPLISRGCNFPEAFDAGLVIDTPQDRAQIKASLEKAFTMPKAERLRLAAANRAFIQAGYTTERIAELQMKLYKKLLPDS
ncbi:MAG: glycosyltransferase [Bacteroidota bacterium]